MDTLQKDMYGRMIPQRNFRPVSPFITEPPPQNSPNHILDALSDKCIQRILSYLIRDIRDFYSAAKVCRKFQDNAKECYPSIYTDFHLGLDAVHHLSLKHVKKFLSILAT